MSGRATAALVTGAAAGIGRAVALRLAETGADVVGLDRDPEGLEALAAEASERELHVTTLVCDLRDPDAIAEAVQSAAESLGGLDVVVNNAGVARDSLIEEMSLDAWREVLEIDLQAYFLVAKASIPYLRESGTRGRIVNMSSRAYLGNPGQANYSAAKAGVIGLTKALSLELGRDGITVNAVAPGMIDTNFVRSHPKADAIIERAVRSTPLRRLGTVDDVASVVAFLASEGAGYVTGEVIHVTGGRYG
jgi:3-oxoacyl-[acyl-carrier protein] reductase